MRPPVVHADLELYLCQWIREQLPPHLTDLGLELVWCSNKETKPATNPAHVHIIVREDPGGRREHVLKDAGLGISLIVPTRSPHIVAKARQASERLTALIEASLVDGVSPMADIQAISGPTAVDDANASTRLYTVFETTSAGTSYQL